MSDSETAGQPVLPRRGLWGIFLVALSILVLQVALTRLLSVVLWYHFAFVAISLAMLGLAVGGILLYLFPALLARTPALLPWLCRLSAASSVGALLYLVTHHLGTAPPSGVFDPEIAVFYLVALLPFLTSGLLISAVLSHYSRQINSMYFFDLVGAALGCVLVIVLLDQIGAPSTILVAALLFLLGGLLFRRQGAGRGSMLFLDGLPLIGCVVLLGWQAASGPLEPRFMHGRPDHAPEQGVEKILARWNSHSRIVVTRTNAESVGINIDGNATTPCRRIEGTATREAVREQVPMVLHTRGAAIAYDILPEKPKVLVIGPGGGAEILGAIAHDAEVTAVELNGIIHELMTTGELAEYSGNVYTAPGVTSIHDEARSWVRRTDERFDLLLAVMVDTWAATSAGAFTLAENALYTIDAFEDFFSHLTDDGIVHINRWHQEPARESLRSVVLMDEVMRLRGIEDPDRHVVVLLERILAEAGATQAVMLWSRKPFSAEQLLTLENNIERRPERFRPEVLVWPGRELDNPLSRFLRSTDREAFLAEYPYDVRPTTDDRPFFFNTIRLTDVLHHWDTVLPNERAVVVLVTILLTVTAIVLLAFVLPFLLCLRRIRRESGRGTLVRLLYFCGLGFGFMLLEITLLQRFGLYLGHPTYTLSTILASLLLGAGAGSFAAGKLFGSRPVGGMAIALIAVLFGVAALSTVVPGVLERTLEESIRNRVLITLGLLTPLGFVMGMPFPLGVRALLPEGKGLVPWAWGMNGATSVLASVLGVAIGMYSGFSVAALVGGGAYLLSLLTCARLPART